MNVFTVVFASCLFLRRRRRSCCCLLYLVLDHHFDTLHKPHNKEWQSHAYIGPSMGRSVGVSVDLRIL